MSKQIRYEQSVFTCAHVDIRVHPFNNHSRTLRVMVEPNTISQAIKVKFSNEFGTDILVIGAVTLALCDEEGKVNGPTSVPLTIGGLLGVSLDPKETIWSDEVNFPLAASDCFAISIYHPEEEKIISGNWVAAMARRSPVGNFTADESIPGPALGGRLARTFMQSDMTVAVTSISEIVVVRDTPCRVLACFGDSVTQQGNWTVPLAKRLARAFPGEISLCNLGISGNRLLHDSPETVGMLNGKAGARRFEEDVLSISGLTHAILEIGSNDIGLPDGVNVPESELITPQAYFETMQELAGILRKKGVKVYVATIPPRALDGRPFNEAREELRLEMNSLLRGFEGFDAILDFDAALRRTDGGTGMQDEYSLIDGLHPSTRGGLCLAKSIDISLLRG